MRMIIIAIGLMAILLISGCAKQDTSKISQETPIVATTPPSAEQVTDSQNQISEPDLGEDITSDLDENDIMPVDIGELDDIEVSMDLPE